MEAWNSQVTKCRTVEVSSMELKRKRKRRGRTVEGSKRRSNLACSLADCRTGRGRSRRRRVGEQGAELVAGARWRFGEGRG